jgi:hypothetical protein
VMSWLLLTRLLSFRDLLEVSLLNRDAEHTDFDLDLLVTSAGVRPSLLQ